MSTVIQIKRSANVAAPSTAELVIGELAYSYDKTNSGAGAKLYIEALNSTDSPVIHTIGGKYYTDVVDGATSNNTASTLVKRDAFGSLAANNISVSGNVSLNGTTVSGGGTGFFVDPVVNNTSGNVVYYNPATKEITYGIAGAASSATQLTTARNITLGGDLSGNVLFDGSQDVTLTATIAANSVALGTDTTGDYVSGVSSGTGVNVSGSGGEGSTVTVDLATSGVNSGTYGGSATTPVLTVDSYGRITSASNVTTTVANTNITGDIVLGTQTSGNYLANVIPGTGLTGSGFGTEGATPTLTLATSGVTANTYGGATNIPVLTVDAYGRITSASNTSITITTELDIAGDAGTGTVDLSTQSLNFDGGDGISTSVGSNVVTITNIGVLSTSSGGYGLAVSGATGAVTITNTGVTNVAAGTGISVNANTGNLTVTNTGVISLTGTANEVNVSSANGTITVGLPDDVIIGRDLSVTGNLYVTGNVVALPVENLVLEDSLIQLANNNISTDIIDIGFYGSYNSNGGEHEHAGLFRDASDSGRFKLFEGLQGQGNLTATVNVSGTGFSIATLVSNLTGGTVSGLTANITVGDGGTGRGTLTTNAILYGQGTSAVGLLTGSAYQVLQLNSSGVPVFGGLDGGSY